MEPAQTIVTKLGGPTAVASFLGLHRTRVSNWQRARESGGTGGTIPQKYHRQLLEWACEREIELKAEEFLPAIATEDSAPADDETEKAS